MDKLDRWIAAYVRMDQRRKDENLALAESDAEDYPSMKPPTLTLAADNSELSNTRNLLRDFHNSRAPIRIRPMK